MNKWRESFARFMAGRYGADHFGRFLMGLTLALLVLGMFVRESWVEILAMAVLVLCYYRMFSKNITKRYEENQRYQRLKLAVWEKGGRWKRQIKERKNYHIYSCPGCGQKIRIPRGKGRISIHCPKCNADFIKKS